MSEPKHAASRPATFGDLFAIGEYRAVYSASALSWVGDYLARAAVTALVFHTTRSVALSAASFAVGYLPGLTAGPFLAALAERYPHRTVMVTCDVIRAGLIAAVAIRGLPVPVIFVLLFCTALLSPPFDASRSALLPRILSGDRYVLGVSSQNTTFGLATVVGYSVGGTLAPTHPHAVLLADAVTFLLSAAIIGLGTHARPAALSIADRSGLLRETAAGFRFVWDSPVLRAIAVIVLGAWLFAIVPEGLAAAWASKLAHDGRATGIDQALIMVSVPVGNVIGSLAIGRFISPARRTAWIRPLAIIVPLALVPTLVHESALGVAIMGAISGFAVAGLAAPANGLFVRALPTAFRARAFGVMQFGLQFVQGFALIVLGLLAGRFDLSTLVGAWSVAGVVVMAIACLAWPSAPVIDTTLEDVRAANNHNRPPDIVHQPDPIHQADPAHPAEPAGQPDRAGQEHDVGPVSTARAATDADSERARRRPSPYAAPRQSLHAASIPVHRTDKPNRLADPQL